LYFVPLLVALLLWWFFHFVAPTCFVDSCRFHGSEDVDCVRIVEVMATCWLVELHLDDVPKVFLCWFSVLVCCQVVSQDVLWNWCLALIMIIGGWIFALYRWRE
jgi:hypothetical protein